MVHATRESLLALYHLLDENDNFEVYWDEGSTAIDSLSITVMIHDLEITAHWNPGSETQENYTLGKVFMERWR